VILEELEIEAHQAGEFLFERAGQIIEAFVDRPAEPFEVGIVSVRQAPAFGQLPQPVVSQNSDDAQAALL